MSAPNTLDDILAQAESALMFMAEAAPQRRLETILYAAHGGSLLSEETIDALLAQEACRALALGADPNLPLSAPTPSRKYATFLASAAEAGRPLLLRALIAGGAELDPAGPSHLRPLAAAVLSALSRNSSTSRCAAILLEAGADPHAPIGQDGEGLLHVSCEKCIPELVDQALACGCDPLARDGRAFAKLPIERLFSIDGLLSADPASFRQCWESIHPRHLADFDRELFGRLRVQMARVACHSRDPMVETARDIGTHIEALLEADAIGALVGSIGRESSSGRL
jgi:hypothetical protein